MDCTKVIYSTAGALTSSDFQLALPHEHIFVETGTAPAYAYKFATAEKVVPIMVPFLQEAKRLEFP